MNRGLIRSFLVVLLGILVLVRGGTGAPNAQVEFLPTLQQIVHDSPNFASTEQSTASVDKTHVSKNALEKTDKTTYKKYPKPDTFQIFSTQYKSNLAIMIPTFFTDEWKLYVLPLVTRAQDPPASLQTINQSQLKLADSKGFTINEEIKDLRIGGISL